MLPILTVFHVETAILLITAIRHSVINRLCFIMSDALHFTSFITIILGSSFLDTAPELTQSLSCNASVIPVIGNLVSTPVVKISSNIMFSIKTCILVVLANTRKRLKTIENDFHCIFFLMIVIVMHNRIEDMTFQCPNNLSELHEGGLLAYCTQSRE